MFKKTALRLAVSVSVGIATLASLYGASAQAQTVKQLVDDAGSTGDVLTYGMGYNHQRYSSLKQVNKTTVKNLVPVWNLSLDNSSNASTQPIVANGVMYVTSHNSTVAVDIETGKTKWKSPIELPADINGFLCCGIHSRGPAIFDGVLYRTTIDAHVMGINIADGKTIWKSKAADYKEGYSMTHAPLVAGGVLMTGISGGEYGTRGLLKGWDLKTGKELWTRYTTAGPEDKNAASWNDGTYVKGGAPTWITGSYDPEQDLVFWGTGNGGPWNAAARGKDSLYICSVLAIRPKTGEIAWYFQFSPGDPYDYDSVNELVVADLTIQGKKTKALIQANRNGFFYVLDRTNGKLLAANQYAKKMNWASGVDLKTGRPIDTDLTKMVRVTAEMKEHVDVWPSVFGSKNWQPMSFHPGRQLAYANTMNMGWKYKTVKPEYKQGAWYLGVDIGGWIDPPDGNRGYLSAIDPLTGKTVWEVPTKVPYWGGVMSTAGDLVFTGAQTGEFMAFDAANGKKLWQFQTGSGIAGLPITYEHKGKQYVVVTSGAATLYMALGGDPNLPPMPAGSSIWAFALK
jgi:alcohol dehydrogenase (cytochrome c)